MLYVALTFHTSVGSWHHKIRKFSADIFQNVKKKSAADLCQILRIVASSAFEASTTVRCCFGERRADCCDRSPLTSSRLSGFDPLALVLALTGTPASLPSSNSDSFIRARLSEGPTNSFPGYLRIASGPEGYPPLLLSLTSFPSCLEE